MTTSPIQRPTILRITDAARILHCSKSTARRMADNGTLRAVARTSGRHRRFTHDEIMRCRDKLLARNVEEVRATRLEARRKKRRTVRVLAAARRWEKIERFTSRNPTASAKQFADFVRSLLPKRPDKS